MVSQNKLPDAFRLKSENL